MCVRQLVVLLSIGTATYTHLLSASWGPKRSATNKTYAHHALHSGTQTDGENEFVIISSESPILPRRTPRQLYLEEIAENPNQNQQSGVLYILAQVFPCLFSR